MKKQKKKNQLGALVKINLPKFNFEEVNREEKNYDRIMESKDSGKYQQLNKKKTKTQT